MPRKHVFPELLLYYVQCHFSLFIAIQTFLCLQKERDLELAARIGQSLLKKNKALSERNELLEEQVEHIREEVHNQSVCTVQQKGSPLFFSFNSHVHIFTSVFPYTGVSAAS